MQTVSGVSLSLPDPFGQLPGSDGGADEGEDARGGAQGAAGGRAERGRSGEAAAPQGARGLCWGWQGSQDGVALMAPWLGAHCGSEALEVPGNVGCLSTALGW